MRIGEMKESKYLKKEDVNTGKVVTISRLDQQDVSMENEPESMKWTIYFKEFDKGMVLNWTNMQLIARVLDSEETNDWLDKKIELYEDPNVSFGGNLVGGIRVRAPNLNQTNQSENPADDVPF